MERLQLIPFYQCWWQELKRGIPHSRLATNLLDREVCEQIDRLASTAVLGTRTSPNLWLLTWPSSISSSNINP
eukprot:9690898-Lingulodinium_polyedra.AAC.1